jgi:hypothetical protein
MLNFLTEMKAAPKGEVWLYSSEYTKRWTCNFKGSLNDLKVEISNDADTLEEAVNLTYTSFSQLANRIVGIQSPMLEHARPAKPVFDDEIPQRSLDLDKKVGEQ